MKMEYIPPKVGVSKITLETHIAFGFTKSSSSVEDWKDDPSPPGDDEGDIWIPFQ
jgi:hypothetical protein